MASYKKYFKTKKSSIDAREIDFRNVEFLKKFIDLSSGKIQSFRQNGVKARYARQIKYAIRRARAVGLMPYVTPIEGFNERKERSEYSRPRRYNNRNNNHSN